jgi:hypothetical protein
MMSLTVSNIYKINEGESPSEQKKTQFSDLNVDCLRIIIGFLSNNGMKSIFDVNKLIHDMKRIFYYYRLNLESSKRYYIDPEFRDLIKSKVCDISKQISVNLSGCDEITDVSALGGVHTLDLFSCLNIIDVSALGGVHTLWLSGCSNITDVSALGGVHTLDLSYCSQITDVSALGGVHTLWLSRCSNITDVSALGGVHTLDLSYCSQITDVSMLGGVHTLVRP